MVVSKIPASRKVLKRLKEKENFIYFTLGVTLLFVVPGPKIGYFDGIPLSDVNEIIGMLLLFVSLAPRRFRSQIECQLATVFSRLNTKTQWMLKGYLLLLVAIKILLAVSVSSAGQYSACYEGGSKLKGEIKCAVSFEDLTTDESRTRWDSGIVFEPDSTDVTTIGLTNWNLGLINDLEFNVYPWVSGNPDLNRFPFRANWSAEIVVDGSREIRVKYVGEGQIRVGNSSTNLPSSYDKVRLISIPTENRKSTISVDYVFDSLATREEVPEGPYATLVIEGIKPIGTNHPTRMALLLIDISLLVIFIMLGLFVLALFRKDAIWHLLIWTIVLVVFTAVGNQWIVEQYRNQVRISSLVIAILFSIICVFRPKRLPSLGIPLSLTLATHVVLRQVTTMDQVIYRSRGDDWMTYQAFARNMLREGFWRGGEDVFYYQPGHRYLLYLSRMIAGDSDAIVAWIQVVLFLIVGVLLIGHVVNSSSRLIPKLFGAAALSVLCMFGTSEYFVSASLNGLTEIPTWILLLLFGYVLLDKVSSKSSFAMVISFGVSVLIRPNQLTAMVFALLLVILILVSQKVRLRSVLSKVSLFMAIIFLPLIHNIYFANQIAVLPTGNLSVKDLSTSQLTGFFSNPETRSVISGKVQGFFNFGGANGRFISFGMPVFALMFLMWVFTAMFMLFNKRRLTVLDVLIMIFPFSYVPLHVFYDIWVYYPRHIVAFNIALLVSGCVVLANIERRWGVASEVKSSKSNSIN